MQEGSLHGLQASLHNENDQSTSSRLQKGSLHGYPLHTASRLQAGSREGLLPDAKVLRLIIGAMPRGA